MRTFITLLAIIAIALVVVSCSISGSSDSSSGTETGFNLPPPSTFTTRSTSGHLSSTGSEFLPGSTHQVVPAGSTGVYSPGWTDGAALADTAYAVYSVDVSDIGLNFGIWSWWTGPHPEQWLGLGNRVTDSWEWFEPVEHGVGIPFPVNGADFLDSDNLLLAVVTTDSGSFTLEQIECSLPPGGDLTNLFFLHHSTGHGIIDGGMRDAVADYNTANATSYEFWDHCYTYCDGLTGPDGVATGTDYGGACDSTDPPDLHNLWTSAESFWADTRNAILDNHEVIAFKSCFPASNIEDAAELQQRKDWYLAMRDFFDTRTDRLFVVVSQPPLHPEETSVANAERARQFAEWLKSGEYLTGHPNVVCFDLFNELAMPIGSGMEASMLHVDYRPDWTDSHPNLLGNATVAPVFAEFLCNAAGAYVVP